METTDNTLQEEIEQLSTMLYQNLEHEAIPKYMDLVKKIVIAMQSRIDDENVDVAAITAHLNDGVNAYKHLDVIGMADAIVLAGRELK
jgi:hypothetical protein